jgi:DNA-binding transcriptional LysR family regulator
VADINFEVEGLQLQLVAQGSVSMDSKQDADIAIQTYRPIRKDLIASKLGEINYGIYASIEYLEKKGIPQSIQDLKGHCFVGTIPETLKQTLQVLWGQEVLDLDNVIKCEDYPLIWQLVVSGCGIGVTHRAQGDADPSVKLILAELGDLKLPVWLVAQPDLKRRARLQIVYSALAKKMRLKLKKI